MDKLQTHKESELRQNEHSANVSVWCPSHSSGDLIMCRLVLEVEVIHMIVLWLTKATCMTGVLQISRLPSLTLKLTKANIGPMFLYSLYGNLQKKNSKG